MPPMFNKLLSRLRRTPDEQAQMAESSPYSALSVIPNRASCPAAFAIMHNRFLIAEAPTLPLPMCTWPLSCTCKFRTHEDRRVTDRRNNSGEEATVTRKERRQSFGRRFTDR